MMSLTTKNQLQITIQIIKKLLSFKADKVEVAKKADNAEFLVAKAEIATKIDRSELPDADYAIELATECGLITPIASNDNFLFIDNNDVIYIL